MPRTGAAAQTRIGTQVVRYSSVQASAVNAYEQQAYDLHPALPRSARERRIATLILRIDRSSFR